MPSFPQPLPVQVVQVEPLARLPWLPVQVRLQGPSWLLHRPQP